MKFLAKRDLRGFSPVDATGEELLRKIKLGDVVTVEVKRKRNARRHRLYFALINLIFENQERYETAGQVHAALKLAAGIYEQIELPSGVVYKIPGSISFDKMDDIEFSAFLDRVMDIVVKHFLPGVTSGDRKAEIETIVGLRK